MKIKLKPLFTGTVIVLMAAAIVLISMIVIISENNSFQTRLKKSQIDIQNYLSEICREALSAHDDVLVINYIRTIKKIEPDVRYAYLITAEGDVLSDVSSTVLNELIGYNLSSPQDGLHRLGKEFIFSLSQPVMMGGSKIGTVYLGFNYNAFLKKLHKQKNDSQKRIIVGAIIAMLLGVGITILVANKIFAPIQRLNEGARLIGKGVLTHRIGVTSSNELGDLAKEFNKMADKLQKVDEIKNNFISSVSHELKTPLSAHQTL